MDLLILGDDDGQLPGLGLHLAGPLAGGLGASRVAGLFGHGCHNQKVPVSGAEPPAGLVAAPQLIAGSKGRFGRVGSLEGGAGTIEVAGGERLHALLEGRLGFVAQG
ncbi:MAG: hypothetical protein JRI68_03440 [Deltaproteobacteria bacterium]|nr:hypothetical protein [Deltaproteobacteria bacterium]